MSINERIKELRKILKLTQNELGDKIGITGSTISDIERGKLPPTDRNISAICKEYDVDEVWLRTGIGNMFRKPTPQDKITSLSSKLKKLDKDSFLRILAEAIVDLSDEQFEQLEEVGKALLTNILKQEKESQD